MLKKIIVTLMLALSFMLLSGCSGSGGSSSSDTTTTTTSLSGNTQKGPFVQGSSVVIYKIGEDFERTTTSVEGNITDDLGRYDLNVTWSGLSEIVVSGYYFDETTGSTSTSQITLSSYTLAVAGEKIETNVNILTHLASKRIKSLLVGGDTFAEAKAQVITEFEDAFGITFTDALDFYGLDITALEGANASVNAELLRLSSALLKSSDPIGDLAELLDAYNGGGVDGLKESPYFKTLQTHRKDLNVTEVIQTLEEHNFTEPVSVIPPLVVVPSQKTLLADINITINPKESITFATALDDDNVTFTTKAQHGNVTVVFVGNEIVNLIYASDDCFVGSDSFTYENETYYGNVNVTIEAPSSIEALDLSNTLYNNETITSQEIMTDATVYTYSITTQPTHGSALLTLDGTTLSYDYDPDDSYVGADQFSYTLTQTIDECEYDSTGTIDLAISEYIKPTNLIALCKNPYDIGEQLYKTDGSEDGTSLVKEIYTGSSNGVRSGAQVYIPDTKAGATHYLQAFDSHYKEVWSSDGNEQNTTLHDINSHNVFDSTNSYGTSASGGFTQVEEYVFFHANDIDNDFGIYRGDETGNIIRIADYASDIYVDLNDTLYTFRDDYNSSDYTYTTYLEKTNGDFSALENVATFSGYDRGSLHNATVTLAGDTLYFAIRNTSNTSDGLQLWAKTASSAAKRLSTSYMVNAYEEELVVVGTKIYYIGDEVGVGDAKRLMVADENSTIPVYTFTEGKISSLVTLNGKLYFQYTREDDTTHKTYNALYMYEPSVGVVAIKEIIVDDEYDASDTTMLKMRLHNDKIVFETIDYDNDADTQALWVSDGTDTGTYSILSWDIGAFNIRRIFDLEGYSYIQDTKNNLYKTDWSDTDAELVVQDTCDITPIFSANTTTTINDADLSTVYEINSTVTGITYPQTKVSISGGEYSLDDGSTWTSADGVIDNNQSVHIRQTSSDASSTQVSTTLKVGTRNLYLYTTTKAE